MSTHYSQAEMARVMLATPACLEAFSRNHSLPEIVTPVMLHIFLDFIRKSSLLTDIESQTVLHLVLEESTGKRSWWKSRELNH